jgi:AraC-like DNA-binding protein
MQSTLKRRLAVGVAAVAASAFGGGAYAATQSGGTSRQAFLDDVAKRLNVSPQQLDNALRGAFDDQLAAAVSAGKLTQAQANTIKQRMRQKGVVPFGLHRFGGPRFFRGPGGPQFFGGPGGSRSFGAPGGPRFFGGPGGPGAPPRPFPGGRLSAAAKYLGLSDQQLLKQLASGKSLAQIATARGKAVQGLEDAMTAAIRARLDAAVKAKFLTSAQEQKILSQLPAVVNAQVNRRGFALRFLAPGAIRKQQFRLRPQRLFPGYAPASPSAPLPAPAPPDPIF